VTADPLWPCYSSHASVENRAVPEQKKKRIVRRVVLGGWIALPLVLPWLSGCGEETVELKGGSVEPATSGKVSAKVKAAEKAEEDIFKKTKKLR
jgi:hypothetical protein